jgi:diguanylate cyclase (GGDEF)-like protein
VRPDPADLLDVSRLSAAVTRALPMTAGLSPRRRALVVGLAAAMLAGLAWHLIFTGLGLGSEEVVNRWGQNAIMAIAVALTAWRATIPGRDRPAWIALAAALGLWTLGNLYWSVAYYWAPEPPFPSPADAGWLAFYPPAYVCLGLLVRNSLKTFHPSMWLDGLVAGFTAAALGTAFVVTTILTDAVGSFSTVVTNAAYPICDLLLVCMAIATFGLKSWRPDRAWLLLGAGFATFAAADSIYLLRLAQATYSPGTVLDSLWLCGAALMALAAWQRPQPQRSVEVRGWRMLALPFGFGLTSIGVMAAAAVVDLEPLAVAFAAAALVAMMVRTAMTLREQGVLNETRRQARTDELTGLPNRRWFDQLLREAISRAEREGGEVAVLMIDLDRFNELNDTLGHHAGDRVLAQLGPRVRSALRSEDVLARLGGNEFAALLVSAAAVGPASERIREVLDERFIVEGIAFQIAASIGVALYPEHGADADTLLQRADVAMYQAKAGGSGTEFYDRDRDRSTRERLQMIGELRQAVSAGELVLHYQPKLDLRRRRITGVEALVRWPHPTRGLVPPGEFIPLAEQAGLMEPLTSFVLEGALRQAAEWLGRGIDLTVAVNVSATNLLDSRWTETVLSALAARHLAPERLVIEITEDIIMGDPERSLSVIEDLSRAGVRVALDDFGTGYSSLSYLKKLPLDELKIDRSFVLDMGIDDADAAIVQTTIDLARRLGIEVVAEGVEDAATLDAIVALGAATAQGFHIARPMPPHELEAWLREGGFCLPDDEDVERARPVDPLDAIQLDVGSRRGP